MLVCSWQCSSASPAAVLAYQIAHLGIAVRLGGVAKRFGHANDVGGGAVLADLPLAVDLENLDLDADDAFDLRSDERVRRVGYFPGMVADRLMLAGERIDLPAQPVDVVDDARPPAHLHHSIIPGRHDLAGLLLGRVPGRRDVGVGALEHRKYRRAGLD